MKEQKELREKYEAKKLAEHMQRFENALSYNDLQKIQFTNDFQILSVKLLEWQNKVDKTDERWIVLNQMSGALLRMYVYCIEMENISRTAIAEFCEYRSKNNLLDKKNDELLKEIHSLKKQVEYYEQNDN